MKAWGLVLGFAIFVLALVGLIGWIALQVIEAESASDRCAAFCYERSHGFETAREFSYCVTECMDGANE